MDIISQHKAVVKARTSCKSLVWRHSIKEKKLYCITRAFPPNEPTKLTDKAQMDIISQHKAVVKARTSCKSQPNMEA